MNTYDNDWNHRQQQYKHAQHPNIATRIWNQNTTVNYEHTFGILDFTNTHNTHNVQIGRTNADTNTATTKKKMKGKFANTTKFILVC